MKTTIEKAAIRFNGKWYIGSVVVTDNVTQSRAKFFVAEDVIDPGCVDCGIVVMVGSYITVSLSGIDKYIPL